MHWSDCQKWEVQRFELPVSVRDLVEIKSGRRRIYPEGTSGHLGVGPRPLHTGIHLLNLCRTRCHPLATLPLTNLRCIFHTGNPSPRPHPATVTRTVIPADAVLTLSSIITHCRAARAARFASALLFVMRFVPTGPGPPQKYHESRDAPMRSPDTCTTPPRAWGLGIPQQRPATSAGRAKAAAKIDAHSVDELHSIASAA